MWENIILFLEKLLNNNNPKQEQPPSMSNEEVEREVCLKNTNMSRLHEIVGENPMDQIDFIIEKGFKEFNEYYRQFEMRTLGEDRASKAKRLEALLQDLENEGSESFKLKDAMLIEPQKALIAKRTAILRDRWLRDESRSDFAMLTAKTPFRISFTNKGQKYRTEGKRDCLFIEEGSLSSSKIFIHPEFSLHYDVEHWSRVLLDEKENKRIKELEKMIEVKQKNENKERSAFLTMREAQMFHSTELNQLHDGVRREPSYSRKLENITSNTERSIPKTYGSIFEVRPSTSSIKGGMGDKVIYRLTSEGLVAKKDSN